MTKYYTPSKTQMRSVVKGDDRYYKRRLSWGRIALAVAFFGLWIFIFLFGLMGWRWK
jgi:hypothetical protein